jgi:hypothetical protein
MAARRRRDAPAVATTSLFRNLNSGSGTTQCTCKKIFIIPCYLAASASLYPSDSLIYIQCLLVMVL